MDGAGPQRGPTPPLTLADRFWAWRDRMVASPRFQAWTARNLFTRRFARHRAEELFDLVAGFVYSQTLAACVELDLFERLRVGPEDPAVLAAEAGVPEAEMRRLIAAAQSLRLLQPRSRGRTGLGQIGASLLGAEGVVEMIRHHKVFYGDLADPVALLRGEADTELSRFWGYVGGKRTHALGEAETAPYTALMAASQKLVAQEVLAAYPVARHRHLLDLGGGNGAFARAALSAAPRLRATVFDLPSVARQAEAVFAAADLGDRAAAVGGDFFADALPDGADLVSLVRVVYDHDDAFVLRLLEKARAALAPGGTLLVAEPMAEGAITPRIADAYFGFYILAMRHGRPRSRAALTELLRQAGFTDIRAHRTARPFLAGVLTARAAGDAPKSVSSEM